MTTNILIIAHAPLASALKVCAEHVYPDMKDKISIMDIHSDQPIESLVNSAKSILCNIQSEQVLVLTDVFGATPCNVAMKIVDGYHSKLVAGVNLPMLLRTVNYLNEPIDVLVDRALSGGTQCIMQVAITAPQNQNRKNHDQKQYDHHQ